MKTIRKRIPVPAPDHDRVPWHATPLLSAARGEHATALDRNVRDRVGSSAGIDLTRVRVHSGTASAAAAELLGARAFTTGTDIYLGAHAPHERERLLTHEAVHAVQQGLRPAPATPGMRISDPHDAGESEASAFASGATAIHARTEPHVQRETQVVGKRSSRRGVWDVELRPDPRVSHGLRVKLTFTPAVSSEDSQRISLVQIARAVDQFGAQHQWTGGDAPRNDMRTKDGFYVDHDPAKWASHKPSQGPVPPYYGESYGEANKDGFKKGKNIRPAILEDRPSFGGTRTTNFETVATAVDKPPYVYSVLLWGFKTNAARDAEPVTDVTATPADRPTAAYGAALAQFDKYYGNRRGGR